MFFTFFKLYIWYQIEESVSYEVVEEEGAPKNSKPTIETLEKGVKFVQS